MDVNHVKQFKFQVKAEGEVIWDLSMQIMNLRAGNANVVLLSIVHDH